MRRLFYISLLVLAIACSRKEDVADVVIDDVPHTPASKDPNESDEDSDSTNEDNENSDNNDAENESNENNTTSDAAPSIPTLVYPLNETTCSNNDLLFKWNPSTNASGNSIEYKLHVSHTASFDSNVDVYITSNAEFNVELPKSTALYWKVEAISDEHSSFSEIRNLYTQGDGTSNTIPQLNYVYPGNGEATSNTSITLEWQANDNETNTSSLNYKVYFSEVGQDLVLIHENTGVLSYDITGLNSGKTYQWSIWVTDENGATNVGEVYTFSVN